MGALQSLSGSAPPDTAALIANGFVLLAFIGTIVAGIVKGVKEWRILRAPTKPADPAAAAAILMDNLTLSDWSASNKDVSRNLHRVCEALDDLRRELKDNADEMRDVRRVIEDRRLGIERWVDQRP